MKDGLFMHEMKPMMINAIWPEVIDKKRKSSFYLNRKMIHNFFLFFFIKNSHFLGMKKLSKWVHQFCFLPIIQYQSIEIILNENIVNN